MARNRMIKPQFWSDEKTGLLSANAKLLFIGMWNFSDDGGKIVGHPAYLKSTIFPYSEESTEFIKSALEELTSLDLITSYKVNNQSYIYINNFLKHQKIDRPQESLIPDPPQKDARTFDDDSTNSQRTFDDDSEIVRAKREREREVKEKEEQKGESNGKDVSPYQQKIDLSFSYEQFKSKYPRNKQNVQPGMTRALKVWSNSVNGHVTEIFKALENYCRSDNVTKGFIMNADKFLTDSWRDYLEFKKFGKDEQDGPIELMT